MFASHVGHDKHHSLCFSFILFPSRLRLVGSAFCLLHSLSCFLLALPKSVPCLEMFGFLYSITIYTHVSRGASYRSFQKHCVGQHIRARWWVNCRRLTCIVCSPKVHLSWRSCTVFFLVYFWLNLMEIF
jgi:hypothetical protein